jgi:hypothetical protein
MRHRNHRRNQAAREALDLAAATDALKRAPTNGTVGGVGFG